jgi:hypothetical protein
MSGGELQTPRVSVQENRYRSFTDLANWCNKALAILTKDRLPMLPDLASAHEQGLVEFEVYYWDAFFMPHGTPAPLVRKLHDAHCCSDEYTVCAKVAKRIGDHAGAVRTEVTRVPAEIR